MSPVCQSIKVLPCETGLGDFSEVRSIPDLLLLDSPIGLVGVGVFWRFWKVCD